MPHRFVALTWHWVTRNMVEKDRLSFETKLWIPVKGQEAKGVWSAESETSMFQTAKAMLQPGDPAQ